VLRGNAPGQYDDTVGNNGGFGQSELKIVIIRQLGGCGVFEQNNVQRAYDPNGHITLFHSIAGS
jgi:hypothetical protein